MTTSPRGLALYRVCSLFLIAFVFACFAAGCRHRTRTPPPPSPLEGVTAVAVLFDYTALRVNSMGGAKSEADWLAAKTAEDPAYPTTWADLKGQFEDSFMTSFAGSSVVPISRFVAGAPLPPGSAVLRVSMSEFQLGKYIPFATTQSSINTTETWFRNEQVVQTSATSASYMPSLTVPSVFQHVRPMGEQSGMQTSRILRERPAQATSGGVHIYVRPHRHRYW